MIISVLVVFDATFTTTIINIIIIATSLFIYKNYGAYNFFSQLKSLYLPRYN